MARLAPAGRPGHTRGMNINGLPLPPSLVAALSDRRLNRQVGSWRLKAELDSFGNRLETELGEVFGTLARVHEETAGLPMGFPANQISDIWPRDFIGPGAIPDIRDFSQIVCFAISGGGEPFCLDY